MLVVDLELRIKGNGTASVFREWPWAAILYLDERDNFPARKEAGGLPVTGTIRPDRRGIPRNCPRIACPLPLMLFDPDLLIYNAGSDPFAEDRLAGFRLTKNDLAERDVMVVTMARAWRHSGGNGALRRLFRRILEDSRRQHRGHFDSVRRKSDTGF